MLAEEIKRMAKKHEERLHLHLNAAAPQLHDLKVEELLDVLEKDGETYRNIPLKSEQAVIIEFVISISVSSRLDVLEEDFRKLGIKAWRRVEWKRVINEAKEEPTKDRSIKKKEASWCKPLKLPDIWRTLNKVRAYVFRTGLSLWDYFLPLDPDKVTLISDVKFRSVLCNQLKHLVGLSEQEISDLTEYFRSSDGRILYTQFCRVVHDNIPRYSKKPLVTGLEWEDPYQVNVLTVYEERRVRLLLMKIATIVNARKLVLRPHFQDYELIAKNNGCITVAHFGRILYFLKINLSVDDFQLLVSKFLKDGYTVNYMAFLAALEYIYECMEENGITDVGGELLPLFPGRVISAELPKLPRPEIGRVRTDKVFGVQKVFHPVLDPPVQHECFDNIFRRLQKYVYCERVRIGEFFNDFDIHNNGRVTDSQFRHCLSAMSVGAGGISRFYLSPYEMDILVNHYKDPNNPDLVLWRQFEDDVNRVFTVKGLERMPEAVVDAPPADVMELKNKGNAFNTLSAKKRNFCEDVVRQIRQKVATWRIDLFPPFTDFDRLNTGHVSRNQFRQAMSTSCIFLQENQLYALEQRYNDEMGFNYIAFIKEVDPMKEEEPLYSKFCEAKMRLSSKEFKMPVHPNERNIVEVLAKIKNKLVCYRIRLCDFMKQFDTHNEQVITRENFKRGLDIKLELTPTEVETLMEVFASPQRRCYIDYKRFCDTVEETFTQGLLERAPLIEPVQHVVCYDGDHNFLNFEERRIVNAAMRKLADKRTEHLRQIFKSLDSHSCGTLDQNNFLRALTMANLHTVISSNELYNVMKCFNKPKGLHDEVDYREFCNGLDVIKQSIKALKC